ncbi:MAG: hypothetical protein ABJA66_21100 [Actinomycetota bacterium]
MKSSLFILATACYLALTLTLLDFDVSEKVQAQSLPNDLVVHEWGTFTAIAGKSGVAVDWRPLSGASDLPKFVYTSENQKGWRGSYHDPGKGRVAKVRMETPVIYFYTAKNMEVDVKVAFPSGTITEWYPQAGWANARFESGINWGKIKLLPNEKPNYLREVADSHYYPARETESVPIQVCNADKTKIEREKFLFYRGVGDFELPLKVKLDGEKVVLNTVGEQAISKDNAGGNITNLIVFENRGGKIGYGFVPTLSGETTVERPALNKNLTDVFDELEKILVAQGLYEKEAKAMIETWKDSWFEEGLRVFYVLPRKRTDEILPLTVAPQPRETIRVLVGRTEVITPEMEKDVRKQVGFLRSNSREVRKEAQSYLKKYGRFYEPILKSLLETERSPKVRMQIQKLIALS